jgi:hypothetical protein
MFFTVFAAGIILLSKVFDYKEVVASKVDSLSWFSTHKDEPDYYFPEEMIFQDINNQYILQALAYNNLSVEDYPLFQESGSATCIAKGYIMQCFNNSESGSLDDGVDSVIFNKPKSIGLLLKYINMS